ncbi:hypothetical protein KZI27_01440 [Curtobacterium sp. TC1]|uniref:hypothetical protein n=1 Tax=Curtobacterium sp. TC1 TaxID=2862880 RepID=UPI001C9B2887|nr:hypothetical protein [Curtobacterium sp. TC1]QZQ55561.1 hypothetical protein KZI27_01440 [Curtobacterium sp. TC1]
MRKDWWMRWSTGYEPDEDGTIEHAAVEAPSAAAAVHRLRDIVGADTDVIYVVPDTTTPTPVEDTYADFLTDDEHPRP